MKVLKALARLWRTLDPRRSVAARLLFIFFLAFLIPTTVFVFLLERRLTDLHGNSIERLVAVRRAQASMQIRQDAFFRAAWMERRAAVSEEAAWSLANAIAQALGAEKTTQDTPMAGENGHVGKLLPDNDTAVFITPDHSEDPDARRDSIRTGALAPLLTVLRQRRPAIKSVTVWTASGVVRTSPWVDIRKLTRRSQGGPADFEFNRATRFPRRRPLQGDHAVWMPEISPVPRLTSEGRTVALFVPVRDRRGNLIATVSLDMDARRFVAEALEPGELPGDLWFATDALGHPMWMTARVVELLHWPATGTEALGDSTDQTRLKLARTILSAPESIGNYRLGGAVCRIASARVRLTGWVFVEGLSGEKLAAIDSDAEQEIPPRSYSDLKGYLLLVFVYLLVAVLAVVVLIARRISAPVSELVHAAEQIGQGRAVELSQGAKQDELGRLAAAIVRMGKRVERRVETLRRLHSLLRTSYAVTDFREILARSSEAIAAFTRAEHVYFLLHDPNTNRLEAAWPGWNVTEETASQMTLSVESRSISGMVFKSGEVYVTNDVERDPYTNRPFQAILHATNAMFCPLKTEERTLGVVVAINRPGGFGHEEVDALTTFADAASLLIKNARLYGTLAGTVEELRRASRLKDHFLQNVNHELRTPLTSIVGWTDLLEEQKVEPETLRRGLKQVRQSARVLLALIDDLLDLARLERGALALELKPVALPDVIQRSLDTVRLMAESRGVVMIVAPFPEPMPLLRADALRLQQVLWNLFANAIKFTPRHGRVIVRVDREPERYLVSVEDDGIGIPESELPHVFERFRQVDGSPTRRHPGMGIGLALARSLVELHGGTIWAESDIGRGSRFTFSLPIPPAERRVTEQEGVAVPQAGGEEQ
jgi:signal transduction histidine kinase/HAMP domain-containing protein